MDLNQLRELIECPVCLESMQTNSRVLPCQHFFCADCLTKIARTERELRCPECRAVCRTPVDRLPTSILLMRILEGMRKAGYEVPSVKKDLARTVARAKALFKYESSHPSDLQLNKGDYITITRKIDANWYYGELNGKKGCFPAPFVRVLVPLPDKQEDESPTCKAIYDFQHPGEKDCLQFKKGDSITFIRMVDENWVEGKMREKIGIFPVAYVELNTAAQAVAETGRSSDRQGRGRSGRLGHSSGQTAVGQASSESSHPKRHSVAGVPPALHGRGVHTTATTAAPTAHQPQRHSLEIQSPSASSSSSTASSSSSSHHHHRHFSGPHQHHHHRTAVAPAQPPALSPTSPTHQLLDDFDAALSDVITNTVGSSAAGSAAMIEGVLPPRLSSRVPVTAVQVGSKKKRAGGAVPAPTGLLTVGVPSGAPALLPHTVTLPPGQDQVDGSESSGSGGLLSVSSRPLYVADYSYQPQAADELSLVKGQYYRVTDRCHDGWHRGTCLSTGRVGVFPGNYVRAVTSAKDRPARSEDVEGDVRNIRATGPAVTKPAPTNLISRARGGNSEQSNRLNRSDSPVQGETHDALMNALPQKLKSSLHTRSGSLPDEAAPKLPPKPSNHHRRSNSIDTELEDPLPKPISQRAQHSYQKERYKCVTAYQSQAQGELDLSAGDTVFVQCEAEGGWYTGTLPKTGRSGLFPCSCVERY